MALWKKISVLLVVTALLTVAGYASLVYFRLVRLDRSQEIAGGLTTGGWIVERDSLGVVHRGYLIAFADGTLISNTLTYGRVVPYAAIGDDAISVALEGLNPDFTAFTAFTVRISGEGDLVVLSAPIPDQSDRWQLHIRRLVPDTHWGNDGIALRGKWRVYGADIFDVGNPIRDGDSGTVEFTADGRVVTTMDRSAAISHGLDFPDVERYGTVDEFLLMVAEDGATTVYEMHSLGELFVLERGEKVPWILVPLER